MPQPIVWAFAAAIIIVALGAAIALIVLSLRTRSPSRKVIEQHRQEVVNQVVRSFNDDLTMLRSQRFGRSMVPHQRTPTSSSQRKA